MARLHLPFDALRVALYGATPHAAELDIDEQMHRDCNATQSIHCDSMLTDRQIARDLGVHERTVLRWRNQNRIPVHQAEDACDHAGVHPVNVWPNYHLLLDLGREEGYQKKLRQNREAKRRRREGHHDVVSAA